MKIVTDFTALKLAEMIEAYPAITAALNAAKDKRRQELEAEIKSLSRAGEKKAPTAAVKFRSKADPTKGWAGRGAEPTWLKQEMKESGLPMEAFKI